VAAYPGNFEFVNAEHGFPNPAIPGPAPTIYFEIAGGLNISPTIPPGTPWLKSITFRTLWSPPSVTSTKAAASPGSAQLATFSCFSWHSYQYPKRGTID
jgi:hypothetical protein